MDKFEEIKNFKELLDNGIITQEEFDKKKQEILAMKEPSGLKTVSSLIGGAKEKSEQAKAVAAEKLEELKKKQAEEAEKRKKEEEERKKKEAELEKQKAEQARIAAEQKQIAAEEKRRQEEEKRKQKEERKEQAKIKRKAFFSKKSVKAGIGIICALIIGVVGYSVYSYVTRDTIKDDFNDTKPFSFHNLEISMPTNWQKANGENYVTNGTNVKESAEFDRFDKDNGNVLGAVSFCYYGDDMNIQDVASPYSSNEKWEEYTFDGMPENMLAFKSAAEGTEATEYFTVTEADYSMFGTYTWLMNTALDESSVNEMLLAPKYDSYKNKTEVEGLEVSYKGSNEDGYSVRADDFTVQLKLKNGENITASKFDIDPSNATIHSGETTSVTIKCHGLQEEVELKGKQVDKIVAKYNGDTEAGVKISKGNSDLVVTVVWDDGTEEVITDYTMDKTIELKAGKTGEAKISAFGKSTTLKVECTTLTEAQFKDKCKTRGYKDLLRKASYAEYTKIYGKVLQDCGDGYYRISSGGSAWDDVYMVTVLSGDTLVEDDWVTCYGVTYGIYTYQTVMGATQKIPWITAKYVDID